MTVTCGQARGSRDLPVLMMSSVHTEGTETEVLTETGKEGVITDRQEASRIIDARENVVLTLRMERVVKGLEEAATSPLGIGMRLLRKKEGLIIQKPTNFKSGKAKRGVEPDGQTEIGRKEPKPKPIWTPNGWKRRNPTIQTKYTRKKTLSDGRSV